MTSTFNINLIGLYTILRREITRFLRIWSQTLLPSMISTTLYFIIFGNLIGPRIGEMDGIRYIEYIVSGLIMMAIITNSYGNVVASFFSAKFQRNIEEMLVSPLSHQSIFWGFILGGVARGVVVGILVTIISMFFTKLHILHVGLTVLIGILSALLFSLAGLMNGIFSKKFDDINIVPTFILTPLTYLGGVFYSIDLLPRFWQGATYGNPIFYLIDAFRFGMLGDSFVDINLSLSVTMSFILVLYILSLWLLKKGVGIKS